ncbi:MAG TPA: hypothetical protein VEG25_03660 [Burkholderiales bacterium]|nr:hypothetical protein [Burkholderiales bacterium]
MPIINPNKLGLVFGVLLGASHLLWAALVASGWAQPLLDFVFWIHFIQPVYLVQPFGVLTALLLIIVTSSTGYIFGFFFGLLWNWFHS